MSKESMARITSPEAKAKRKADPWTLEKRVEYLTERRKQQIEQRVELFQHFERKEDEQNHLQYVKENVEKGLIKF